MSNIITTKGLALNLLPEERELAIAFQGRLIKDINKADLETFLISIIENTYKVLNWKYEGRLGVVQAKGISKDIKTYFYSLTVEEILICFTRGAKGIYGEFMGLSEATYYNWLRSYMTEPLRMEAKKKQHAFQLEASKPKELTLSEKEAIMKKGILDAYEIIKSGKEFNDLGNSLYNWLDKKGKIPFALERKKAFMELARVQVKAKQEVVLANETEISQRRKIKSLIEAIEISNTPEVIVEAKKIALVTLFKDLIEMEEDVNELLA